MSGSPKAASSGERPAPKEPARPFRLEAVCTVAQPNRINQRIVALAAALPCALQRLASPMSSPNRHAWGWNEGEGRRMYDGTCETALPMH